MSEKRELDLRGVIFPVCLLKCKSALVNLDSSEALDVLVNDPEVVQDLIKIIKRSQARMVNLIEDDHGFRIMVGPSPNGPSS
jgi:TusA-related sulfurtransferase